jgi:hypothetical protein
MKRTLTAALFALSAATVYAGNQYINDAGEQDQHAPIAKSDEYRNDAGEQDQHTPIADAGDKGVQDQNFPQVG